MTDSVGPPRNHFVTGKRNLDPWPQPGDSTSPNTAMRAQRSSKPEALKYKGARRAAGQPAAGQAAQGKPPKSALYGLPCHLDVELERKDALVFSTSGCFPAVDLFQDLACIGVDILRKMLPSRKRSEPSECTWSTAKGRTSRYSNAKKARERYSAGSMVPSSESVQLCTCK